MKRINFTKLISFVLVFMAFAISNAQDWEWRNPLPQGNRINDIYAFNESKAIAVGDRGTIMRTSNGGESWQISRIKYPKWLYSIHFANSTTGFISDSDGQIYKSTDGGETWEIISKPSSTAISNVYCLSDIDIISISYDGSIFKSTDGGETWNSKSNPGSNSAYLNEIYFIDDNVGFIVGGSQYGQGAELFKTTDRGETWTDIAINYETEFASIFFINSTTGFIVGKYGTILKTTDVGETWTLYEKSGFNSADYDS